MIKQKIRTLEADEIDIRGQSIKKSASGKVGVVLLLYKDARVDMNILDETFGIYGWQREHNVIDGNLYCTIKIKSDDGEWISKQDVGIESNTEKEKGQASDSFKRAAFNIGIGRELYTAPLIWVELSDKEYYEQGGQYKLNSWIKFCVQKITYLDGIITDLIIADNNDKVRYSMKSPVKLEKQKDEPKPKDESKENYPEQKQPAQFDLQDRTKKIYFNFTGKDLLGWTKEQYNEYCKEQVKFGKLSNSYSPKWTSEDCDYMEGQFEILMENQYR